ncbi:MAG: hypothetical protein JO319_19610 [Acidobacteriaceae bacterium]|nr:hypothetical protein [Acidobacteriaceae bacterium]
MSDVFRERSGYIFGRTGLWVLIAALACLRLSHVHLLWADEDYHLAAALNVLHGKVPYRDFWYDKPPLCALYYTLCGAYAGWALRLLDALYVFAAAVLTFRLAREWWGEAEGCAAAFLLTFFLTFYLASAVIPFAADALMIVPHIAAIERAFRKRAFAAGVWCGIAFLFNVKAVFVLATCIAWMTGAIPLLIGGFLGPLALAFLAAVASGAWQGYSEQVWRWGLIYAAHAPVSNPIGLGLRRTLDWLGFQAVLTAGAIYQLVHARRPELWRAGTWLLLSFAAVCLGERFAPHYFLQLLPPMAVAGGRGLVLAWRNRPKLTAAVATLLLLLPFVRFAPAYVSLAADDILGTEPHWSDVVLDLDSQHVAQQIKAVAQPGDTLFVWGYRPDIYVYTRMISGGLFSDSQPLTGVPADRHLHASKPVYEGPAAQNRTLLTHSQPTFIVDGLGLMNPQLAPGVYPEIRRWLAGYKLIGRTQLSLIYRISR